MAMALLVSKGYRGSKGTLPNYHGLMLSRMAGFCQYRSWVVKPLTLLCQDACKIRCRPSTVNLYFPRVVRPSHVTIPNFI